jgi:hypothetical protein
MRTLSTVALLALAAFCAGRSEAGSFTLPATTSNLDKLDLGFFSGGTDLAITMSGTINIASPDLWVTNPNGSLADPVTIPAYTYANAGATNYPTTYGGDGINHFSGGGANYDVDNPVPFGFAGKETTDTTDPAAIRTGSVVGTFSPSPTRADWFFVGYGTTVLVPTGGAHLYVAVVDTYYPNDVGSYSGMVMTASIPEPSSIIMGVIAILSGVGCSLRRRP